MSVTGELADRLDAIVADLDELAFDRLREAAADGGRERPASDRELVKARRAVEKAAHILRSLSEVE
ncbi:MAG: hypothetical protein ACO225_14030 [Ilumatobacteraceae bacterium]